MNKNNPTTMITERTLRNLIKAGFPCVRVSSKYLVNVDTFDEDLRSYVMLASQEERVAN